MAGGTIGDGLRVLISLVDEVTGPLKAMMDEVRASQGVFADLGGSVEASAGELNAAGNEFANLSAPIQAAATEAQAGAEEIVAAVREVQGAMAAAGSGGGGAAMMGQQVEEAGAEAQAGASEVQSAADRIRAALSSLADAGAGAIAAGREVVEGGQTALEGSSLFSKGADMIKGSLMGLGEIAGVMALVSAVQNIPGAMKGAVDGVVNLGEQTLDLTRIMGGNADQVSAWASVFNHFDTQGTSDMTHFARNVQQNSKQVQDAFATLGVDTRAYHDMVNKIQADAHAQGGFIVTQTDIGPMKDASQLLAEVQSKLSQMPDSMQKTAIEQQLFGRSGADLNEIMDLNQKQLIGLMQRQQQYGATLSGEQLAKIEAYKNQMRDTGDAMQGVKNQVGLALLPLMESLATVGTKAAEAFSGHIVPALGAFAHAVKDGWDSTKGLRDAFMELAGPGVAGIKDAIGGIAQLLAGPFGFAIKLAVGLIVGTLIVAFVALVGPILAVGAVIHALSGTFGDAFGAIKGIVSDGKQALEGAWSDIVGGIRGQASAVGSVLGNFFSGLGGLASRGWAALTTGVKEAMDAVLSWVEAGVKRVVDFVVGLQRALYDAGRDFIQGFINGIKDMVGDALGAISDLGSSIINAFKQALGIASPSRFAYQAALDTGAGYVLGLAAAQSSVVAAAQSLAQSALGAMGLPSATAPGAMGAMRAAGAGAGPMAPGGAGPQTIVIHNYMGQQHIETVVHQAVQGVFRQATRRQG